MFLLFAQLGILTIVLILNTWLGEAWGAYERIWWWDIPTHFLGGVSAGLFSIWFLRRFGFRSIFISCVVGTLFIGTVWEIYEHFAGLGGSTFMSYWADTIKDIVVDTLGAITAGVAIYLERTLWQRK